MKPFQSTAIVGFAALSATVSLCPAAGARQTIPRSYDVTHLLRLNDVPISGYNTVTGQYFAHTWMSTGQLLGVEYDAVPTQSSNPFPPYGFRPYGVERLAWYFDGLVARNVPINFCLEGYSPGAGAMGYPPCHFGEARPALGSIGTVQPGGTGGPLVFESTLTSSPTTFGRCEFEVAPFTLGSGLLDARIRSAHHSHYAWDHKTYAFSWLELVIERRVNPQTGWSNVPFNWNLAALSAYYGPPPPPPSGGFYPVPARRYRYFDPISFVVTDVASNNKLTGEVFELFVDLSPGGSCAGGAGSLWIDTQSGGLRVRMDHPFISPQGTLDLEFEGGVVVTSRATGWLAATALPPVGAVGPQSVVFPSTSFDMVFDASSVFPLEHDVVLSFSGAGAGDADHPVETGASCASGVCLSGQSEAAATAAGATWLGPQTACASAPYFVENPVGGFEDIANFGQPSIAGACDDCGEVVPLGFDFDYFGQLYSSVGVSSNGYLAFSGSLGAYLNEPLPSASGPNGLLAGYWDDLNPAAGGTVHTATVGVAPARRFIAQWTDVPHYNTLHSPHTFQIVLHESSGRIDFVYLDTPPLDGPISPTVGIESPTGAAGIALDAARLAPKATRHFIRAPGVTCSSGPFSSYCTAGTTTNGCTASMTASGVPSASASAGCTVSATNVEGQKLGIVFYGVSGAHSAPWFAGSTSLLCVKSPVQRLPAQGSGGVAGQCNGVLAQDLLAWLWTHPSALGQPFAAGDKAWVQAWFRDPSAPGTTNLSNGLELTFAP